MRKLSMEELGKKNARQLEETTKLPVRIILDNIRSLHNIGSIFRTADALMVESIYLCGICAVPPNREIQKAALGATETVRWEYFPSTMQAVNKVKIDGFKVIAIEQTDSSIDLADFQTENIPMALIFGNEVNGVSDEVLPFVDQAIEIPQFGTKHSFNVSVAAGIVLYQLKTDRK